MRFVEVFDDAPMRPEVLENSAFVFDFGLMLAEGAFQSSVMGNTNH